MASNNWINNLRSLLESESDWIRDELRSNLEAVMAEQNDQIESFAKNNISLECSELGIEGLLDLTINPDVLTKYISAAYFANARYFERDVNLDRDQFDVTIPVSGERATHMEIGKYNHRITVPLIYFSSGSMLLHGLDAETRHAVHTGIQHDQDLLISEAANRAYHVIAETLDEGSITGLIDESTPQIDPYLNDHIMFNESDGHNGAEYFSQMLSFNPRAKRMQLYWLSRLPIRRKVPQDDAFTEMIKIMDEISQMARKGNMKLDGEEMKIAYLSSPFDMGLDILHQFYLFGKFQERTIFPTEYLTRRLTRSRRLALDNHPYEVESHQAVNLQGKILTRFASQLDYVALKLSTSKPRELYALAKRSIQATREN